MIEVKVKVKRVRTGAILPMKAYRADAGWDLYSAASAQLWHMNRAALPTGIAVDIPPGYYGQILGRSGLAACGVAVLGGVIDPGYRGEVTVLLANLGTELLDVAEGDRIAQLVILPLPEVEFVEVAELGPSSRGAGGLGSTGR